MLVRCSQYQCQSPDLVLALPLALVLTQRFLAHPLAQFPVDFVVTLAWTAVSAHLVIFVDVCIQHVGHSTPVLT